MTDKFEYRPSSYLPFRDLAQIERCRKIKREEIENHPNSDFRIRVRPADEIEMIWVTDMFRRIKQSDDLDRPVVLILPNPCGSVYRK